MGLFGEFFRQQSIRYDLETDRLVNASILSLYTQAFDQVVARLLLQYPGITATPRCEPNAEVKYEYYFRMGRAQGRFSFSKGEVLDFIDCPIYTSSSDIPGLQRLMDEQDITLSIISQIRGKIRHRERVDMVSAVDMAVQRVLALPEMYELDKLLSDISTMYKKERKKELEDRYGIVTTTDVVS